MKARIVAAWSVRINATNDTKLPSKRCC